MIQLIYSFIEGSPKRHAVFEDIVKTTNTKLKTLKSLSETRWACRSEAVSVVHVQLNAILQAFKEIIEDASDSKARAKGKGILHQIESFDFIICLEIMHPILQLVVKVSQTLQSYDIDLCQAMDEVSSLAIALEELRIEAAIFDNIYSRAVDTCNRLGVEIPAPRKRKVSVRLDNNSGNAFVVQDIKS